MIGLLSGIRVLDLTTVLSGPFATYQLSLLGADVTKIEIPGIGDLAREIGDDEARHTPMMGASFLAQNAGKRSITVDLKSDEGKRVFARLVQSADVLVENMRPGVLGRLGFSWEQLQELNPRLIYCAITGFGQDGPLADRPAYDQIVQGLAGMTAVTGFPDGESVRVGFPICDTVGGYAGAMAVCAALVARGSTGHGVFLDVSMLETSMTAMGWAVSNELVIGEPSGRIGNDNVTSAPSGTFRTAVGGLNIAANTQVQFEAVCRVCGCEQLIDDPRFLTRGDRKRHRAELRDELEVVLAARSAAEWEVLLAAVSVAQPQIAARGLLHEVDVTSSVGHPVTILGSGVHVDGQVLAPSMPPPQLGEHSDELLREVGYSDEEIATLRASRAI
jgi:crotonobetainyl-CoA:carnitine CoA-transferase CaiB-like acyl-CoA transferase